MFTSNMNYNYYYLLSSTAGGSWSNRYTSLLGVAIKISRTLT